MKDLAYIYDRWLMKYRFAEVSMPGALHCKTKFINAIYRLLVL